MQCAKCRKFYPPDFTEEKNGVDICIWCNREIEYLTYEKDGRPIKVTKEQVAKEYKQLLRELAEKKNIKKFIGSNE